MFFKGVFKEFLERLQCIWTQLFAALCGSRRSCVTPQVVARLSACKVSQPQVWHDLWSFQTSLPLAKHAQNADWTASRWVALCIIEESCFVNEDECVESKRWEICLYFVGLLCYCEFQDISVFKRNLKPELLLLCKLQKVTFFFLPKTELFPPLRPAAAPISPLGTSFPEEPALPPSPPSPAQTPQSHPLTPGQWPVYNREVCRLANFTYMYTSLFFNVCHCQWLIQYDLHFPD